WSATPEYMLIRLSPAKELRLNWELRDGELTLKDAAQPRFSIALKRGPPPPAPRIPNRPPLIADLVSGFQSMQRNDLDAALAHLEEALRGAPDDPRCHSAMVAVLRKKGRVSEAKAHLRWLEDHYATQHDEFAAEELLGALSDLDLREQELTLAEQLTRDF